MARGRKPSDWRRKDLHCAFCGKLYPDRRLKPSELVRLYCSTLCARRAVAQRKVKERQRGVWRRTDLVCVVCGAKFADTREYPCHRLPQTCSLSCRGKLSALRSWTDGNRTKQQLSRMSTCEHCGKEFKFYHCRKNRFCSKACAYAHRTPTVGRKALDLHGYVLVCQPDHPEVKARLDRNPNTRNYYVREHRLVMEQQLGRTLLPGENVHHKNGVKDDNRPENLELWLRGQPAGQRYSDMVAELVELRRELTVLKRT